MNFQSKIVITGAAGFIGSCLVGWLNQKGFDQLILVDDFSRPDKVPNLSDKKYFCKVHRESFFDWLQSSGNTVDAIFHLGARTDTTDKNPEIFERLNLEYSKRIWIHCAKHQVPLIYASSAATYGAGELGYEDSHDQIAGLLPLNLYGLSKQQFDLWALAQPDGNRPPFWAGLKFFNVYGPNEYHKGRMASVVFHGFQQVRDNGSIRLFRSHRSGYQDGEQLRDFIYVRDLLETCDWLMEHQPESGIYNLGTGHARTFNALANAVFRAMKHPPRIVYIDMPMDIRNNYQYFTEAKMDKLLKAGYPGRFTSLEEGVKNYVTGYLEPGLYF